MSGMVLVGVAFGFMLLAIAAIVTGCIALVSRASFPDMSVTKIAYIAALGMPALYVLAVILLVATPIGVDENGPQISGGIAIGLGLIISLIFGFSISRAFAIWLLRWFK